MSQKAVSRKDAAIEEDASSFSLHEGEEVVVLQDQSQQQLIEEEVV